MFGEFEAQAAFADPRLADDSDDAGRAAFGLRQRRVKLFEMRCASGQRFERGFATERLAGRRAAQRQDVIDVDEAETPFTGIAPTCRASMYWRARLYVSAVQ